MLEGTGGVVARPLVLNWVVDRAVYPDHVDDLQSLLQNIAGINLD